MNDIAVIQFVNGGFSIVSTDDFPELNKEQWFRNSSGYAHRQWNRRGIVDSEFMHRRVNRTPSTLQCDHINQCKFDNRRINLRRSDKRLDSLNRNAKGVSIHKATGLWRARVGERICKYFKTESEALEAYLRLHAAEVARISAELALVPDDYSDAVIPPKKGRRFIPMIREQCVEGDIARIPLLRGDYAIIDASLFDELSKIPWRRADTNHVAAWVDGKYVYLHRLVFGASDDEDIDHKNRNPLDNRRCNLRLTNDQLNRGNQNKFSGEYSSEFKGVSWHKVQNKWISRIRVGGTLNHLGYFTSEIAAMSAYNVAALKAFGEHACLNVLR